MTAQHTRRLWDQCLDRMRQSGSFLEGSTVAAESADIAYEAVDYLFMTLASAYILMAKSDPDYPEFKPWVNHLLDYAAPNPDATYYFARIAGDGTYRVFGYRNTVHWVDFMTGYDFVGFKEPFGKAYPSNDLDDFAINADGSFEILLSPTRPEGHDGNWIEFAPDVNYLVIRQFANHPDELDARMGIERLDPSAPPRPFDTETTRQRIDGVIEYLHNAANRWPAMPAWLKAHPPNEFRVLNLSGAGEVQDQAYLETLYELGPDEAMIIEFAMPRRCSYWNIQASDRLWRTLEYMHRHTSFNGHIDRSDGDGIVRIVVAHEDPGVMNWVDACGVQEGHLLLRFQKVDPQPQPSVRVVASKEVLANLPADTKRVTPGEREGIMRRWRMARQLRRSW